MNLLQILYYLMLAIVLFFILNYFKKLEEKTPSVMILIPVIYILLVSELPGISREFIYFVILIEMIIRIYYTKLVLNQGEFINYHYYVQNYGLAFILGYVLTEGFLIQVDTIFPQPEEVRIGVWLFIILFLYKVLNGNLSIQLEKQDDFHFKMKEEAVVVKFARLKNKYSHLIKAKDRNFNLLIYAMMIYEDNHRSKFLRNIDRILYRFTGKMTKMGIMQVESLKELTDEESIKMVLKELNKIEKDLTTDKKTKKQKLYSEVLKQYYLDENKVDSILAIYDTLKNFDYK